MKTPMQELIEFISEVNELDLHSCLMDEFITKEEIEIKKAFDSGRISQFSSRDSKEGNIDAEQYYNETYNK